MLYEYTGVVYKVCDQQIVGKVKQFIKRDIIVGNDINDNAKKENHIKFSFKGEKAGLLDCIRRGSRVKIVFALNGRLWNGDKGEQCFTELIGIGIYPSVQQEERDRPRIENTPPEAVSYSGCDDDCPF